MATHDLLKIDSQIRATIAVLNAEGLRLHGRSTDLTEEGKRKEWERLTAKHPQQIATITAEVEAVAAALEKVEDYERDHLLRPVPEVGLNAAQELRVARLLARPGAYELEALPQGIRPHLETVIATVLVEEIQAYNPNVSDAYVSEVLAQESHLYKEALKNRKHGYGALDVLRQGLRDLDTALDFSNVNGAPLDNPHRPGQFLTPMDSIFSSFKIADNGNTHL